MTDFVDKRELILAQLLVIGRTIPGVKSFFRNRGLVSTDERPAFVLLDGDELPTKLGPPARSNYGGMTPQLMVMTPEMYFLLPEARPTNDEVGSQINALRIQHYNAMASDATLRGLIGPNGTMTYYSTTTDLKSGSTLGGTMRMNYQLTYVLQSTGA